MPQIVLSEAQLIAQYRNQGGADVVVYEGNEGCVYVCQGCEEQSSNFFPQGRSKVTSQANSHSAKCPAVPRR
ncbi:hypothetical protein [Streptomyces niveus]|uniref:hypothetical protein n=1 Tax=Streptomyces niveus TaxID=193462 RepID=UPI0034332180